MDFERWRTRARALLRANVPPHEAAWEPSLLSDAIETKDTDPVLRVPRPLLALLELCACYDDPRRWALMYRVLWRATRGGEAKILEDEADPDVRRLQTMAKAIAKDVHRMHAFVRFREGRDADGAPLFAAWFEPEHDILAKGAPFFVERMKDVRWVIVTPRGAARWDGRRLVLRTEPFAESPDLHDPVEKLWRTYYGAVFNPARVNARRLAQEMPRHFRAKLPEARDIPALVSAAGPRVQAMHAARPTPPRWSTRVAPVSMESKETLQACRRCPLHARATQAVCGAGPQDARLMLVGEQPGDEEDLRGTPFVGPAGRVLGRALDAAGVRREALYLTNAVKHFKWEPRGKRRVHRTPAQREVDACAEWLERELGAVHPRVVVAMGATAAYALTGAKTPVSRLRGMPLAHPSGAQLVVTYHPAAVLRADEEGADAFYRALCEDLRSAARLAA